MLQSQQSWLPVLHQPVHYEQLFRLEDTLLASQKFIAHCEETQKTSLASAVDFNQSSQFILIGPEGDFTEDEINLCKDNGFLPVSISGQRLRTETAAITVCAYFNVINDV